MAQFTVTGEIDPFLHVSLLRGEKIYCESNAMVMMESALELKGKMTGGLGSALMRRFANGESFFSNILRRREVMVIVCCHPHCRVPFRF